MANAINWFEIPTADFDRAKKFYAQIFDTDIQEMGMENYRMGRLPANGDSASEEGIGGAIVKGEGSVPSENGTLVYLNGGADLSPILARIEDAGGKVVMPKTMITEDIGYMAIFIDSEGNRVALHSQG